MWTIRVHGEADTLFDAVLRAIPAGCVVRVEHANFTGDAEFLGTAGRSVTVRPTSVVGVPGMGSLTLDWADLDALEVY